MLYDVHVRCWNMVCVLLLECEVNVLVSVVCGHVLHRLLPHLEKPLLAVHFTLARTSVSRRFLGLRKAAMGTSGMALLHLRDVCSVGKCFLRM